jgi:hypothetical protein
MVKRKDKLKRTLRGSGKIVGALLPHPRQALSKINNTTRNLTHHFNRTKHNSIAKASLPRSQCPNFSAHKQAPRHVSAPFLRKSPASYRIFTLNWHS